MSDGNFNRALLPSTPYRSGVKMGFQQAKAKAVNALSHALEQVEPSLSPQQKADIHKIFDEELRLLP